MLLNFLLKEFDVALKVHLKSFQSLLRIITVGSLYGWSPT